MNYCPACHALVPEGTSHCPACSSVVTEGTWKDRLVGWLAKVLMQFVPIRKVQVSDSQTRTVSLVHELPEEMRTVIKGDSEIEIISLEDAPPDVRARIEEAGVMPEGGTVYTDADGNRQVFSTLEEAPPDIQRKIRELRRSARPGEIVRKIRVGKPSVRIRTSTRHPEPGTDQE